MKKLNQLMMKRFSLVTSALAVAFLILGMPPGR